MNAHDLRHQVPPDSSSHRTAAQSGVELAKCRTACTSRTDGASATDEIDAYRALFRAAPIGLLVSSSSGRILDASDAALRLLGLEREDAIGKTRDDIGLLPLEWRESQKEASGVFEVAVSREVESKVKMRSGEVRDVIVSIGPVHMHNETCVVTTLVDVTERFAARDRRAVSERLASVATLGAGVASQIDNPMTCVTTYLELLADHVSKLGDGESEPVETMKALVGGAIEGASRVAAVVERMHMLSRAQERRRTPLDVAQVVEAAVDAVQGELRNRARLVKTYGASPTVVADEAALLQVFVDLLANAARAVPAGHPDDNEVSVSVGREGDRAVVRIRDTGQGMGPETQQRIFDPFFSTSPSGSSPGLGLSICDRIVSELGGEISIESKPGAGTSVRVALPARTTKAGPFAANPSRPFPLKTRRTRGRVLLVDDDLTTGEELQQALSDHDVSVAQTAGAALEHLASGVRFDAIVCSLALPGMTGMDLYEQVVLRMPELCRRMVFLRGGAPSRDARDFLERIPNRRLAKPCDANALRDVIGPLLP